MKKLYSFLFLSVVCGTVFSQTNTNTAIIPKEKCGTMANLKANSENIPGYAEKINAAEFKARQNVNAANAKTAQTTVVIPVVFHVLYPNASSPANLHDSVLVRQLAIMNETYSLSNPNFANTRAIFDTLGANTDVQFCFAGVDPLGNACTGIDRFQTATSFSLTALNNGVKIPSMGGRAAGDAQRYLNIWCCDMSFFGTAFVLGFATFPGGPDSLDGVVLQYEYVGMQNNGTVNNLGRTAVHEVGHWLGMRHIWGDGQQSTVPCDSTDYVEDTPHANNASATDCDTTKNTCSTEDPYWTSLAIDPPDMVENYMDYSNDGCMTMFTKGQKARMWSFINTLRSNLLTNNVTCATVGIDEYNPVFGDFIHVYPNPVNGLLNINFSTNSIEQAKVEFYNAAGQLVKVFVPSDFQNVVEVKGLASGIYFLKISNPSNCAVKKIVIQDWD
ncbi:MAG: T9SS type A sorting domain-containing protein [Bacteroidia bacterium]|nr:T9SS type A sorting domain-containing protein [Bacteroidia bacterium]